VRVDVSSILHPVGAPVARELTKSSKEMQADRSLAEVILGT
jgi:hypothetical protein